MRFFQQFFVFCALFSLACGGDETKTANEGPRAPERWPARQSITNDVDRDIEALLEYERIDGACDRWQAGERDEETKMLCGKWMFFYETFGTVGIPSAMLEFGQEYYVDYYGVGFSNFNFVADPTSETGMPLGLAPSTGTVEGAPEVKTHAFTCASCHFGQMPDGRYAVGYGNMQLDYGRFIAGLGAPINLSVDPESEQVDPTLREELVPYVEQAEMREDYGEAIVAMVREISALGMNGPFDTSAQSRFLDLQPGTMDFLTPPLLDDEVWTVSRILSLWNLPSAEQRAAIGMPNEMLSWTGGSTSLDQFIVGFVALGVAETDDWPQERIEPLEAYIRSLRVPELEEELDEEAVARGADLFVEEGCLDCHNGPSGESAEAYSYAELGVDDQMQYIFSPDEDGTLCCGLDDGGESYVLTGGIKAPRLTGVDFQTRFLHNGSVENLDQLLCLERRPEDDALGQGSQGHEYGCELQEGARRDLITYLRSL